MSLSQDGTIPFKCDTQHFGVTSTQPGVILGAGIWVGHWKGLETGCMINIQDVKQGGRRDQKDSAHSAVPATCGNNYRNNKAVLPPDPCYSLLIATAFVPPFVPLYVSLSVHLYVICVFLRVSFVCPSVYSSPMRCQPSIRSYYNFRVGQQDSFKRDIFRKILDL